MENDSQLSIIFHFSIFHLSFVIYVYRDMLLAGGVEFPTSPAAPPVTQPQTGELRHNIQLRRPAVTNLNRVQLYLIVSEDDELALDPLARRVVLRNLYAHVFGCYRVGAQLLSARKALHIGHESIDHECPVLCEMSRDVAETSHLLFLRQQRE